MNEAQRANVKKWKNTRPPITPEVMAPNGDSYLVRPAPKGDAQAYRVERMTTLNQIRSHSPCAEGWAKLLKHLNKTKADDEPLSLITILNSNGLGDAIWCLRTELTPERIPLFALAVARRVEHLHPAAKACNNVTERYLNGQATKAELDATCADDGCGAVYAARAADEAARAAYGATDSAADAADAADGAADYAAAAAYAAAEVALAARADAAERAAQAQIFREIFV